MTSLCGGRARRISAEPNRLVVGGVALALVAIACSVIAFGPILTNDGPVHVAFAHLVTGDPSAVLQSAVYEPGSHRVTNAFGDLLMSGLMTVVSPASAESILQALCLLAPVVAGVFCIAAVDRRNAWLAVLLLPLSLNEMFFLGLYNFCLSTAAFLGIVGLHLRMAGRYGLVGAVAMSVLMLATFALHPAGFVATWVCLAAMTVGAVVSRVIAGGDVGEAVFERTSVWVSLALTSVAVLLLRDPVGAGEVYFGRPPVERLLYFLSASSLALTHRQFVLSIPYMLVLLAIAVFAVRAGRAAAPRAVFADERSASLFAGFLASLLLMMVFPDSIGGGWTHFRRFVLFPYLLVVVGAALFPYTRRQIGVCAAVAAAVFLGLAGDDLSHQANARDQLGDIGAIDRAIGPHCTVLPIVLDRGPLGADGDEVDLKYQPYFQVFSRLETRADRVVLFDFLARLDVYAIRYAENADPHETLFGWRHRQQATRVDTVDVDRYERASGLHVDYVLVFGRLEGRSEALRAGIAKAIAGAAPILDDGRIRLYRRLSGGGRSRCGAAAGATGVRGGGRAVSARSTAPVAWKFGHGGTA